MITKYTFEEVKLRRAVQVRCTKCRKLLRRVLTRSYFINGFHDPRRTHAKYDLELNRESKALAKNGTICTKCEGSAAQ